jgi:hypothetical protein
MDYDEAKIEEAVLALLGAFVFTERGGEIRAWKTYDFAVTSRLFERGLIEDPRGHTRSVCFTPAGIEAARAAAARLFASLHPSEFHVNEAWIAFRLNNAPVHTEQDGSFNCFALMDAASCFILGAELVSVDEPEPTQLQAKQLLKAGRAHKKQLPATLFVPRGQFQAILPAEAKRQGISVVAVPESQLLVFIGEARQSYAEHIEQAPTT